jgi:hypothetical protein
MCVLKAAKSFFPLKLQATPLSTGCDGMNVCEAELFKRIEVKLWPLPSLAYVDGVYDV